MLRILLCDDQLLLAEGIQLILESDPTLEVVGVASDGARCIELIPQVKPDIILMDLKMPGMNGSQATAIIRREYPTLPVLILTTFNDEDWVMDAIRGGASGYILKDATREQLIRAVKETAHGKNPIDSSVTTTLMKQVRQPARNAASSSLFTEALSDRDREILALVAQGMSNARIGEQLALSEGTIRNSLTQILAKLNVSDRTHAAVIALRYGLID
jgi:DNA-binding NarL/FixJ family response regulator